MDNKDNKTISKEEMDEKIVKQFQSPAEDSIIEENENIFHKDNPEEEINNSFSGEDSILSEDEETFNISISEEEQRIKELEDLVRRQAADFDNFRKRMQDEKEKIKNSSQEGIILDFLPIFDNIERAFDSCQSPEANIDSIKTGLEGILLMFGDFLTRHGIEKKNSIGEPFDVKFHEALFSQEGDYKQKEVIQEVEKAYIRNDKVLRTAKVAVGIPKPE